MPTQNGGNINFKVGFQTDRSGLNQITKALQQIQSQANRMSSSNPLKTQFESAASAAKQLESIISGSWNDKLNQLNLNKFNQSIQTAYGGIDGLKNSLSQAGAAGNSAFNSLASEILHTNLQLKESNKLLDSMATSMANTVKWGITSSIFNNITGAIQKAYYYSKDLDTSLNNIRIVTGDSADQMERFAKTANSAAKQLGRSTLDYTKAATSFYQQGLGDEEVEARTKVALKAQNITGAGGQIVDQLTAVWNGFQVEADKAEQTVDKLAAVADNSASDMSELATAMSKVASTANVMGVDVDQLNAQLATVIATTRQAPQSVGTAFKTIYSRLNDIQAGSDEAEISLGNYSGKMAELGFNVLDASGKLRDTGQVIEQIGSKWDGLTKQQQVYLAQTMGGQRQITQVMALFDNWGVYLDNLNTSLNAQGALNEKNNVYLESTAAHLEQLGTEAERTYDILFDQNTVNGFVDIFDKALIGFNDFIEGIGGGANVFVNFGAVVANVFNKQISEAILKAEESYNRFLNNKKAGQFQADLANKILQERTASNSYGTIDEQATAAAAQREAELYQKTLQIKKGLTQESYNELMNLQKQSGQLTAKIELVSNYKDLSNQILGYEETSYQNILKQQTARKESLSTTQQLISSINRFQTGTEENAQSNLDRIKTALEQIKANNPSVDLENTNTILGEVYQKIQNGTVQTSDINKLLQYANGKYGEQKEALIQIIRLAEAKKAADEGDAGAMQKQREAVQRQMQARRESAAHAMKIQQIIRGSTAAVQAVSSIVGGISTALDQSATTTEKINGAWSAASGSLASIANYFAPGSGILVQGVMSIGKSLLEITGIWDKIEDHFKSTAEKLEEAKKLTEEIVNVNSEYSGNRKQIESIADQFEELAKKRQQGIDLTQEEENKYHELVDTITQYNNEAIIGYDNQGDKIVNNNTLLQQTLDLLDQQYQKKMRNLYEGDQAQAAKNARKENYDAAKNRVKTLQSEQYKEQRQNQANLNIPSVESIQNNLYGVTIQNEKEQIDMLEEDLEAYNNAYDKFIEQLNKSQGSAEKINSAVVDFLTVLNGEDLSKYDNTKFFIQLIQTLQDVKKQTQNALTVGDQVNAELESAQIDLNNALQLDFDQILGEVKFSKDNLAYKKIEESWGDDFKQYGASAIDSAATKFLQGLQEELKEKDLNELPEGSLDDWAKRQLQTYLQSLANLDTEAVQQAQKQIASLNEKIGQKAVSNYQNQLQNIVQHLVAANKKALTDSATKDATISFIENLLGIDNLEINEDGTLNKFDSYLDKFINTARQHIYDASSKSGSILDSFLSSEEVEEFLKNENVTQTQIIQLTNAIKESDSTFFSLEGFKNYFYSFFKAVGDEDNDGNVDAFVNNISKILSIIKKLQDGKNLTPSDKKALAESILSEEEMEGLETREDWLEAIINKIKTDLVEGSQQKLDAIRAIYNTFEEFKADEYDIIGDKDRAELWGEYFDQQLNSLGTNIEALEEYAEAKKKAFNSEEQQEAVLQMYQTQKGVEQLRNSIKGVAEDLEQGNGVTDNVIKFINLFEELTGEDINFDWLLQNIDALQILLQNSNLSAEQLIETLKGVEDIDFNQQILQQDTKTYENGTSAYDALSQHRSLTSDQQDALDFLEQKNQKLAQIAEDQGRNSQDYLFWLEHELEILEQINALREKSSQISNQIKEKEQEIAEMQEQLANTNPFSDKATELIQQIVEKQAELNTLKEDQAGLQQQINDLMQERVLDSDVEQQTWMDLTDLIQSIAEESEELADALAEDQLAAEDLAQAILRYDSALQDVSEHYQEWAQILQNGNLQDQASIMDDLRDAYADMLDLPFENLSEGFLSSAKNLDLMKQAAEGAEWAYDALRQAAFEDIVTNVGLNLDDFYTQQGQFYNDYNLLQNSLDDIEIGASLTGQQDVMDALTRIINAADMTAQEATDLLSTMGVDAEVSQEPVQEEQQQAIIDAVPKIEYNEEARIPSIVQDSFGQGSTVDYQTVPVPTINYEGVKDKVTTTATKKATALRITSANKSSGGNFKFNNASHGGGISNPNRTNSTPSRSSSPRSSSPKRSSSPRSSTPKTTTPKTTTTKKQQKKEKDPAHMQMLEEERDRYHDINIKLKAIQTSLDRVQKAQKKLVGKDLINNLNKQLKILQQQTYAYQQKVRLAKQERDILKNLLENQGVTFNADNTISNYEQILTTKMAYVNQAITNYNAFDAEQQEKYKDIVENFKKEYQAFKKHIQRYDQLISEELPGLQDSITDNINKKIELQVQKFKVNIELQLDIADAQKDFNKFRKQVIDQIRKDDILGQVRYNLLDFSTYFQWGKKDLIDGLTEQVNNTLTEIARMERGLDSVYGDNKALAMQDLKDYSKQLMDNLEDVQDLINDIKDSIYDAIDNAQDALDDQIDKYEYITDLINHNSKVVEMLYGEDAYDSLAKYYNLQQKNNNKQLDFLRQQVKLWQGRMKAEQNRMRVLQPDSNRWKEANDRFEEYCEHWADAVDELNDLVEDSLQTIIDKYSNSIEQIFDKLNKELTAGRGLDYIDQEWELINDQSDMYLDKINSMYQIDKLRAAYQDAINDNDGNLKIQKSLTDMMNQQLKMLEDKDKLSKYDVDRANALLQIEIKRLGIEQVRQNKTKLRLRRDSQGNYTYQYTSDKEDLDKAQQELNDAQNNLYNMTRDAYKNNLSDYYKTVTDWEDKIKDVYLDTTLSVQEQQQKVELLNRYYGERVNSLIEQNEGLRQYLMYDTFVSLAQMYDTDVDNFMNMSDQEKSILQGHIVPQWDSGIQHMITTFSGYGGFEPTVVESFNKIQKVTDEYQKSLNKLQQNAGVNFKKIADGIDTVITRSEKLLKNNQDLIDAQREQIRSVQLVINEVDRLIDKYNEARIAAINAASAANRYITTGQLSDTTTTRSGGTTTNNSYVSYSDDDDDEIPDAWLGGTSSSTSSSSSSSSRYTTASSGSSSKVTSTNKTLTSANVNLGTKVVLKSKYGDSEDRAARRDYYTHPVYGPGSQMYVQQVPGYPVVVDVNGTKVVHVGTGTAFNYDNNVGWVRLDDLAAYRKGGYTGKWGSAGKLGILHEEELILNANDTKNILSAVNIVRDMNNLLEGITTGISFPNRLSQLYQSNGNNSVDQTVHITAEFPAVNNRIEIENAFENLINKANQFAYNTRK